MNSTARWPERLEHIATVLRAEGAAVLALSGTEARTLFASRIDDATSWREVLGDEALHRVLVERNAFAAPIAAGRWGDGPAYAVLIPLEGAERGVLCALRRSLPFGEEEVVAAGAAARLLSMAFADAQAVAQAERDRAWPAIVGERLPLRVLLMEAHPVTRIGLETLLTASGAEIVASTGTAGEALQRIVGTRADVALMDTALPDAPTTSTIGRLRAVAPGMAIVTFGDQRGGTSAREAMRAGASGHVGKDAPPTRIVAALQAAAAGLSAVDPATIESLLAPAETPGHAARESSLAHPSVAAPGVVSPDAISRRELDLLRYLAEGYTNKEIARVMVLAEDTVKKGVQSVIAKLGAADRTQAVALAIRRGLVE